MIKNIFKLTVRNLYKNSLYATINILGLTIGITVFLGILTLVKFENSFNRNIPDSESIYRIYSRYSGTFSGTNRGISNGVPAFIRENFTGIEESAHFHTWSADIEIPQKDGSRKELERQSDLTITTPSLIPLIGIWQWEAGDISSMERPNSVVLLRSQAEKYFGQLPSDEYLGRDIIYQDSIQMQVVGIVSDPEGETDFAFTDFISDSNIESTMLASRYDFSDWDGTSSSDQFFLKLSEGAGVKDLEYVLEKAVEEKKSRSVDDSWLTFYEYQPLEELHYNSELGVFDNTSHAADTRILRNLLLVALAILLIAIINFVNLETAIGGKRSREIGIRKVLGSSRQTVMGQFLVQSTLMTFIAVLLSIPLTIWGMNSFSEFLPEGIEFHPAEPMNILIFLAIVFFVGLLSGFYPSLVLSSYNPVKVLKGNTSVSRGSRSSNYLRKGLTVFQFTFSQVLLIVTFLIYHQIDFMMNKDLGFKTENILYFSTPYYLDESRREVMQNELNSIAGIQEVLRYQDTPISNGYTSNLYNFIKDDGTEIETEVFIKGGDSTYTDFFGIRLITGRPLRGEREVYINETYMQELGFSAPSEAMDVLIDPADDSLTIAGVVKDFHFRTLHNEIKPVVIRLSRGAQFALKLSPNTDHEAVSRQTEEAYARVYPDLPFNSRFFKNSIEEFYKSEERTSVLVTFASGIALLISCLGLFGLSSFMAIQRTKEIGIRKVQGATVRSILKLLTSDFLKLVGGAVILAIPVAYWLGTSWMEDFAYKAPFSAWIFLTTGIIALLIAFLTVSYHALSAARINPVESLRSE